MVLQENNIFEKTALTQWFSPMTADAYVNEISFIGASELDSESMSPQK